MSIPSIRGIRAALALPLVLLAFAGCDDPAQPPAVRLLRIQPDSSTIPGLGLGVALKVVYVDAAGKTVGTPAAGEVSWSSLDPTVVTAAGTASPDQGQATAQGAGRARIVATAGTQADTAVVGVVQVPAVVGVGVLNGPQLVAGGTLRAVAEVNDSGGIRITNPSLTWSTSNPAVLTVDASGRITGTGAGTADLRVQSGPVTASVNVRVLEPFVASAFGAGGFTTCGVDAQGRLSCWAGGHMGQLGTGVQDVSLRALRVDTPLLFTQVSVGGIPLPSTEEWPRSHVCAVTTTGAAFCWGVAQYGQLGTGSLPAERCPVYGLTWVCSLRPVAVAGNISWSTVVAGATHTCGISTAGVTYCWGANEREQLGAAVQETCPDGFTTNYPIGCAKAPVPLAPGAPAFTSLALGQGYTCGLTAAGAAWCWGTNGVGQLGDGTTTPSSVPVEVVGGHTFTQISAELSHTCGLTAAGAIYCWGGNLHGELGVAGGTYSSVPVPVSGGGTYVQVSTGPYQTCALRTGGAAFCWGWNGHGALGIPQPTESSTPVAVPGGHLFSSVSVGTEHTCGRRAADGILMCWGYGFWLGAGEGANEGIVGIPVAVQAPAP